MSEAQGLHFERELINMGLTEDVAQTMLAAHPDVKPNKPNMTDFRQGLIDAARTIVDGTVELITPEEVRENPAYQLGYEANSVIILEKQLIQTERMAA